MPGFFSPAADTIDEFEYCPASNQFIYSIPLIITSFALMAALLARYAETRTKLQFDSRIATVVAGLITMFVDTMHTTRGDMEIPNTGPTVIALVPHRTSVEVMVALSKIEGPMPHVYCTDLFNNIPFMKSFLDLFPVIFIKSNATKSKDGRSANQDAKDEADAALQNGGRLVVCPQGNYSRVGLNPYPIYNGAAERAITNNVTVQVYRLDGFDSLSNERIPLAIRNWLIYRSFLSIAHPNNIRVTLCREIDVHLQEEHALKTPEEKMSLINAELYAYAHHTQDLTPEQISRIDAEIASKQHLKLWQPIDDRTHLRREIKASEVESVRLEEESAQRIQHG